MDDGRTGGTAEPRICERQNAGKLGCGRRSIARPAALGFPPYKNLGGGAVIDRRFVYEMLDPALPGGKSRTFRIVHHLAVVVGVATVILDTVPSVASRWGDLLDIAFLVTLAFFAAEYALRIYAAPEAPWAHP